MESFVVEINGEEIPLRIVRRNNKNIYFRFDTDGALVVSANPRISAKKILKLVKENESSLESMYKRIKKRMDEEGEIRILGLKYDLVMDENVQDVYFDNGAIYVRNLTMLNKYLNKLTKREKEIIEARYGLNNKEEKTQKEIAQKLGISRSYVSRIEKRATTKILREFIKNNHV